jgi:glycine oxidase
MPDLRGLSLAIVGAGAVGLTLAVRASQSGARTTLYSMNAAIDSASGVAAGMLAPAFEAALDTVSAGHFDLLRIARNAWPEMIAALELPPDALDRSGALYAGAAEDEAFLTGLEARLRITGAACERLDAAGLQGLSPKLSSKLVGGVFTPEDWRIDPVALLSVLEAAFARGGGRRIAAAGSLDAAGRLVVQGAVVAADAVIIAAGPGALAWRDVVPELSALHAIKGQILHFDAHPRAGPVVRGKCGYVAPQPGGAIVGATMEVGRNDVSVDAATVERLRLTAADLFPDLGLAPFRARAGVRVATADGLPLVGPSELSGVHLAVGARRNGWLLAPLISDMIVSALAGQPRHGAHDLLAASRVLI